MKVVKYEKSNVVSPTVKRPPIEEEVKKKAKRDEGAHMIPKDE